MTTDPGSMNSLRGRVWATDVLHALFFLFQATMWSRVHGRVDHFYAWLAFDVVAVLSLLPLIRATGRRPARDGILRLLHGVVVVPVVFTQVGLTLVALNPADHAADLAALDRFIFLGTDPIEFLEKMAVPWFTELMQWSYTAYLLLPPAAILLLVMKGTPALVARSSLSLIAVIYLSYLGYYLIPASGPNINNNFGPLLPCHVEPQLLYVFKTELPGIWMSDVLREWMFRAELAKFDCFPSGHVAVAVACAVYATRVGRAYAIAFWTLAGLVTFSTMYLRYHYVIDVVVGVALAVVCVFVLESVVMGLPPNRSRR